MADGTVMDIDDEIPFDVPEGWAWCRLKEVCTVLMGQSPEGSSVSGNSNGMEFHQGKIYFTDKYLAKAENYTSDITRAAPANSILLCVRAPVGVVNITNREICIGRGLCAIRPKYEISENFWFYWLQYLKEDFEQKATGTTFKAISVEVVKQQFIPIPTLNEQKNIVSAIENIFAQIDTLEQNKSDLQTAIKQAKSKILDLAIHGKLVSQNPTDEPASVLLEKLRAEKEAKIKSGELKRDKNDSYIYKSATDNCHYQRFADGTEEPLEITNEIPQNWTWCSLGEISTKLKRGKSPTYTEKSSIMAFAQKCNQKEGPATLEKALYIDESTLKKYSEEEKMQFNDIVINSTGTGTLGRVGIFNCKIPDDVVAVYPDSHVSSVRINPSLFAKYFYYFVKNKQNYLEEMGEGSTNQKELKIDTIANLIVPLPPLAEQKRIVEKIENAFAKLDFIAEQLA